MPRKGKRITRGRGLYEDSGGFEVRVTVGGRPYSERMPKDSTLEELKARRAQLEALGRKDTPKAARGTLTADATHYLRLMKHLASWKERKAHLDAWCDRVGDVYRHRIAKTHVLAARVAWLQQTKPLAPKTINHRVDTLRHLYRTLDGQKAPTPCDDVTPLEVPRTPIHRITNDVILGVDQKLAELEQRKTGRPMNRKTRARFRVYATSGKRPSEIMRIRREDIDFDLRVWVPRDAKGGYTPGVYLNDDLLAALRFFDEVNAYGRFSTGAFQRTLIAAGWPKNIRPYHMRHTTWITASELGIDLQDIAIGAGHKDPRMTRKSYVPVLNSRLQQMSERLDGRFKGWTVVPNPAPSTTDSND